MAAAMQAMEETLGTLCMRSSAQILPARLIQALRRQTRIRVLC